MSQPLLDLYLDAILAGERHRAFSLLDDARGNGTGVHEIYLGVFQPALYEIGRRWQAGEITVADEHLATAITQSAMARLYHDLFRGTAPDAPTVIAACAPSERHELGLRMVCDLLELDGWDTTFLGASVPREALVSMVADRRPRVVALSASLDPHLPELAEMVEALRAATRETEAPPLLVGGGRALTGRAELAAELGFDLTADDGIAAMARIRDAIGAERAR